MTARHAFAPLLAALLLGACQSRPPETLVDRIPTSGGGRDEHGCITSAGYRWCAARQGCIQPWQLTPTDSPEKADEAFEQACKP
ncbi:MAG: hypothetical protein ACREVQ_15560 [Burkholderiales bacterium]